MSSSLNKGGDRVAIMKLNAELRHAQLEMLSAQCATDRLRLNFTADHVVQHGEPEVLRKAVASASALHHYYNSIAERMTGADLTAPASEFDEKKIPEAVRRVAAYIREQREEFFRLGKPLRPELRAMVAPFFTPELLASVRVVEIAEQRLTNPTFYAEAKKLGFANLPEITHMSSMTFEDVLVFQAEITPRRLFHALVHAAQFSILGLERYTERYVNAFLKTASHITVPLEAQAFTLESKFANEPDKPFSVEEKVWLWNNQGRY